jgi:hypothetical protein
MYAEMATFPSSMIEANQTSLRHVALNHQLGHILPTASKMFWSMLAVITTESMAKKIRAKSALRMYRIFLSIFTTPHLL